MAIDRNQNSPHIFQGSAGAPTGFRAVVQPAFSMATTIDDIKRHLRNLHKDDLWQKGLHADLLDGYHLSEIYVYLATLYQPLCAQLTALCDLASNGIIARTASATVAARTITAGASGGIQVADGNGVSGNPTLTLPMFRPGRTAATLAADSNNQPISTSLFLVTASGAARTITGFAAVENALFKLDNVGSQNVVLAHESESSTDVNRIVSPTGTDLVVSPGDGVWLAYDAESAAARWRING